MKKAHALALVNVLQKEAAPNVPPKGPGILKTLFDLAVKGGGKAISGIRGLEDAGKGTVAANRIKGGVNAVGSGVAGYDALNQAKELVSDGNDQTGLQIAGRLARMAASGVASGKMGGSAYRSKMADPALKAMAEVPKAFKQDVTNNLTNANAAGRATRGLHGTPEPTLPEYIRQRYNANPNKATVGTSLYFTPEQQLLRQVKPATGGMYPLTNAAIVPAQVAANNTTTQVQALPKFFNNEKNFSRSMWTALGFGLGDAGIDLLPGSHGAPSQAAADEARMKELGL